MGRSQVVGIPPLDQPKFISAREAAYLEKKHVVFGVYLNGEARDYPKRILAWHELFNDTVGGAAVTCAYCTLCGAAVLYAQQIGERSLISAPADSSFVRISSCTTAKLVLFGRPWKECRLPASCRDRDSS